MNKYNADVIARIRSEVGGHFATAIVTWLTTPDPTGGLEHQIAAAQEGSPAESELIRRAVANVKVRPPLLYLDLSFMPCVFIILLS